MSEEVTFNKDSTFVQNITYADRRRFEMKGIWKIEYKRLELSKGFVTRDGSKNRLLDSPTTAHGVWFIYTGPTLEIEPEQGYVFTKTSPLK